MDNNDTKNESGCCTNGVQSLSCRCSPDTTRGEVFTTTSTLTFANRLDHFYARWGVDRMGHRVDPGLYRLGNPTPDSPVFVTANYTLSFDSLRSALTDIEGYILVLDTKGINVWCAAGKGTFGTDELVRRIELTGLSRIVSHRKLILPQLGAPGVSWPDIIRRTGFSIEYGPVRAHDLPEFLKTHTATPGMRRVRFPLRDRVVLAPVELVHVALPAVVVAIILYFLAGPVSSLAAISAVLAGTVLFPVLLPYIPTHDFSTKGLILGLAVSLPFAAWFAFGPGLTGWANILAAATPLLIIPAVTAYLALNFTGSTPFASRTGVRKEIFRYVKPMAVMAGAGVFFGIVLGAGKILGVI